ncbi:Hint domain-containing protein [Tropicimonas aquimaris]|uniref:Hint domain-containing protein n=1 Tax=Tropicimonas aquimaris TaxID=914152 RepID=A0ABW3IPI3_9RHOB
MENAPKRAFARAHPVPHAERIPKPLVLRPEHLSDGPARELRPGAWLVSAVAAEARIMTPTGPCPAGRLVPGECVLTLGAGACRVLWTGRRCVTGAQLADSPNFGAVVVPEGAFGGGAPRRPLRLSPHAGVLVFPEGGPAEGVLVPARDLCGHAGITMAPAATVTYVQLLLERHAVIVADGLPVESFHPGALDEGPWNCGLRAEILSVLPDLEHDLGLYGPEARGRATRRQ